MGLVTIYLVYRIGADRYEEQVGLAAAAVLTVTAGFVPDWAFRNRGHVAGAPDCGFTVPPLRE
jgi:hypothetical protein